MSQLQLTYILISALGTWTLILSFYLIKAVRRYTKLTKGADNVDLGRVLEDIIKRNQKNEENVVQISKELENFQNKTRSFLQKFTLIRFNPFEEEGGDQSFVIAFLNGKNDGVVISSLHSRSGVRIYAKQVENGKSAKHQFTKEEKEAVEKSARQI
ncbi:MAG: hypothetical protein UV59_C0041G0007 [Candidatus Gottesmanbacteria bacterium GW2011_GWA1_43_11]|uniref:DUF4446 domain-containing protein n=2 Tax=Microgenomates group TaxID=1794810 RepID=A0A1F5I0R0_9BACT|nr:MAG: hypothetical protein UV59_C0041G0007 [Candidatus Gottesmanbacteria bacterium GW2011_GWA1_43_11]OGE09953.1 MAG: hypothetical protein A3A60_04275 [Candidatus Curtissbacteria bacterium RIFCSPLOWO2_01_FULL_42_26]